MLQTCGANARAPCQDLSQPLCHTTQRNVGFIEIGKTLRPIQHWQRYTLAPPQFQSERTSLRHRSRNLCIHCILCMRTYEMIRPGELCCRQVEFTLRIHIRLSIQLQLLALSVILSFYVLLLLFLKFLVVNEKLANCFLRIRTICLVVSSGIGHKRFSDKIGRRVPRFARSLYQGSKMFSFLVGS